MSEINQFKSDVIDAFIETHGNNLPLMIQVPGALIIGKLKDDVINAETVEELNEKLEKLDSEDIEKPIAITNSNLKFLRDETNTETKVSNTAKGTWLKDVKIRFGSLNHIIDLPVYFLFFDQIIGVSYGILNDGQAPNVES